MQLGSAACSRARLGECPRTRKNICTCPLNRVRQLYVVKPTSQVAKSLVAVQNCQTWLLNLVATLVKDNVLPREALDKMDISLRN